MKACYYYAVICKLPDGTIELITWRDSLQTQESAVVGQQLMVPSCMLERLSERDRQEIRRAPGGPLCVMLRVEGQKVQLVMAETVSALDLIKLSPEPALKPDGEKSGYACVRERVAKEISVGLMSVEEGMVLLRKALAPYTQAAVMTFGEADARVRHDIASIKPSADAEAAMLAPKLGDVIERAKPYAHELLARAKRGYGAMGRIVDAAIMLQNGELSLAVSVDVGGHLELGMIRGARAFGIILERLLQIFDAQKVAQLNGMPVNVTIENGAITEIGRPEKNLWVSMVQPEEP